MPQRKIVYLLFMFFPVTLFGSSVTLKPYNQRDSLTHCDAGLINSKDSIVMFGEVDIRPNKISESDHIEFTHYSEHLDNLISVVNVSLHNCTGVNSSEDGYCQNTNKEGVYIAVFNSTAYRYHNSYDLVLILHQANGLALKSLPEAFPKVIDILDVQLFLNDLRTPLNECDMLRAARNDVIKFCCYADPATCNVSIKVNGTKAVSNDTCVEYRSKHLRYTSIAVGYTYCKQTAWIQCQWETHIAALTDEKAFHFFPHKQELSETKCDAALKSGTDRLVMVGAIDITLLPYAKHHEIEAQITSTGEHKSISVTLPKIDLRECYLASILDKSAYCYEVEHPGWYFIIYNITMEKIYSEAEMKLIYSTPYRSIESPIQILPPAIDQSKEVLQINGKNATLPICDTTSVFENQTIKFCCYVPPTTCFVSMLVNKDYRLSGSGCVEFSSSSVHIYRVEFGYTYCGETKYFTCELPKAVNETVKENSPVEVESGVNWMFILISVIIGASLASFMKYIVSKIQLTWREREK